jgi:tRNA(Met) C34 N-acetyltransferase TmcA
MNIKGNFMQPERRWLMMDVVPDPGVFKGLVIYWPTPETLVGRLAGWVRERLGTECQVLVWDCAQWPDEWDALAALMGTLVGGGLLVTLHTGALDTPMGHRFRGMAHVFGAHCTPADLVDRVRTIPPVCHRPIGHPLNQDQAQALAALLASGRGHRRRPVVLLADRGRGKTSALALAAGRWVAEGLSVTVMAPSRDSCSPVLAAGATWLPPARWTAGDRPQADRVLVDEAAALDFSLLAGVVRHYPRVCLATTENGYEGQGRGFGLKFRPFLDRTCPGWKLVRLQQPVRWAADDPLEQALNQCFLFGARPGWPVCKGDIHVRPVQGEALEADPALLERVHELLVMAHYRNRPSDLARLLAARGAGLMVAFEGDLPLGCVLSQSEGPLPDALARAVLAGRRRPPDGLLPQTMALHGGHTPALGLRMRRVVRIAVHPDYQGRGIGRRLLTALEDASRRAGEDVLGSSFGFSAALLRFWCGQGFVPCRLGHRPEGSTGAYPLVVATGFSPAGQQAVEAVSATLPFLLQAQGVQRYRAMPGSVLAALLRRSPATLEWPAGMRWSLLSAYARGLHKAGFLLPELWAAFFVGNNRLESDTGLAEAAMDALWQCLCGGPLPPDDAPVRAWCACLMPTRG